MKRIIKIITTGTLATIFFACGVKDLRTKSLKKEGLNLSNSTRGKEIIIQAISAHGGANWQNIETLSFEMYDRWNDPLGKSLAMPISANKTNSKWIVAKDKNLISIHFLDGKHKDEQWGIKNGKVISNTGDKISKKEQEKGIFYWSAIPYFLKMPFVFKNTDVISFIGEEQLKDGKMYEKVFVSWNKAEPQKEVDQWILWFDKSTHKLTYADHTLRDMVKFMKATAKFSDYQEVAGVLFPQKVDLKFKAEGKFIGHEMSFSNVHINEITETELSTKL